MALPPWCSPQRRCAVQCCDAAYVTTRWLSAEFINIALISIILNGIYFGAVVCTSANGVTCVAGFGQLSAKAQQQVWPVPFSPVFFFWCLFCRDNREPAYSNCITSNEPTVESVMTQKKMVSSFLEPEGFIADEHHYLATHSVTKKSAK